MNPDRQAEGLESSLLATAKSLAQEYLERGRQGRDHILEEANERLRLREEREVSLAKAASERFYRQRVQAAQIRLQRQLDQLRWGLVQEVLEGLTQRLAEVVEREDEYLGLLQQWLGQAAERIEAGELVAEFNGRDLARVERDWVRFVAGAGTGKSVLLAPEARACSGGVLVRSADNRIRVDATFEGRRERYEEALYEVVMERLFADTTENEISIHG